MNEETDIQKQTGKEPVRCTDLVRRLYRCPKCMHTMRLADEDVWGKVVRCTNCAEAVADNRTMPPPNTKAQAPAGKRPTLNIMPIQQRAARVLQQIDEKLALAKNATPGPWQHDQAMSPGYIEHFVGVDGAATAIASDVLDEGGQPSMANATFIAASRSGWPVALRCLKTVIEGMLPEAIPYSWRAEMLTTLCDEWEENK